MKKYSKNKFKKMLGIRDIYNKMIVPKSVSYSVYYRILVDFFKFMSEKLLEGEEIKLPFKLGKIYIIGNPTRIKVKDGKVTNLPVDWKKTKKLWEEDEQARKEKRLIRIFNEHSDGYVYRFTWSRKDAYFANKFVYDFIASRNNKRTLAKLVKQGKKYRTK